MTSTSQGLELGLQWGQLPRHFERGVEGVNPQRLPDAAKSVHNTCASVNAVIVTVRSRSNSYTAASHRNATLLLAVATSIPSQGGPARCVLAKRLSRS
jgi:hypothetical protein